MKDPNKLVRAALAAGILLVLLAALAIAARVRCDAAHRRFDELAADARARSQYRRLDDQHPFPRLVRRELDTVETDLRECDQIAARWGWLDDSLAPAASDLHAGVPALRAQVSQAEELERARLAAEPWIEAVRRHDSTRYDAALANLAAVASSSPWHELARASWHRIRADRALAGAESAAQAGDGERAHDLFREALRESGPASKDDLYDEDWFRRRSLSVQEQLRRLNAARPR